MKNLSKKIIILGLALLSVISFLVFGNVGNVADNETLRTQIRYNADEAGVILTDVWTHVQSDRKMVIFGGTLSSTQQLQTLFFSITNFNNFITQIQQTITTPDGNPYPQFFTAGFDPYPKNEKKKSVAKKSETESVIQPEITKEQLRKQQIQDIESSGKHHESTEPLEYTDQL